MVPGKNDYLPDYRLVKRLVILAVTTLILSSVAFSVWRSVAEYRLTIRGAELQTRGYARALKEHADRTFNEADAILLNVVEHIQEHGGIDRQSGAYLKSVLASHARNAPHIATIVLVNRNGVLFAHSSDAPVREVNVADRDYFIHHRDHATDNDSYLSKPFKSRITGEWRVTLSRCLRSADGTFLGVVAVSLDLNYFVKFYKSLDMGPNGKIILVRRDGTLLVAVPYRESDFDTDFKKSHLIKTYLPSAPRGTFHIPRGKALLESGARIISYDSQEDLPVIAIANLDKDEILAPWLTSTYIQAALVVALALPLGLLALVLLRQLKRIETAHRVQREQQDEIASAAGAWQSTFDAVEDAIWVMDADRHILRANRATEKIFHASVDTVVGRRCCEVAHNSSSPIANCPFGEMIDTGHRASLQIVLGERWYDVSVDPVKTVSGEISGAVHIVSDITDIKLAEEKALESETRIRGLLSAIPDAILFKDAEGRWLLANDAGIELFRLKGIDYFGKTDCELAELVPERRDALLACNRSDQTAWDRQELIHSEETLVDSVGNARVFDTIKIPLFKQDGSRRGMVVVERDITEQRQMEMQLLQAQKMEAIGHLAGGIAHDFNNLLTPILGYAEMILGRLEPGDPLAAKLAGISAAAHKAKELTRQLLNFGRRQHISRTVFDLNEVIESFHLVLRRTIRESVRIDLALDPAGAFIAGDRSQMEQVILNLTVNAQDALDGRGTISVETRTLFMDGENLRRYPGMTEGNYVLLSFHDTGCGMSSETLSHVFEPFFTTKPAGHGTGLGLATVYGIVKQHNGHIGVTSREGEETTFRIYLPAVAPPSPPEVGSMTVAASGDYAGKTILLAEDSEMVREMIREMLEGYGFHVLAAADGNQALDLAASNRERVELLVSDIVMPVMNGTELYEKLLQQIPSLKVVYVSGYPMNPGARGGSPGGEVSYLQKPFSAEALLERIRSVL